MTAITIRKGEIVEHEWKPYPGSPNYEILEGTSAIVRTRPTPTGKFLWQVGKRYGMEDTVELAKNWAEAMVENNNAPKGWKIPL